VLFSFSGCLKFVSDSNIPPSAGLDMCPPRQPKYIIFSSLGIMLRVLTVLHLYIVHIDEITRAIAIYNDTYKFVACPYNTLQKFAIDNKVMVMSHPEAVRKLYAWLIDFDMILKRSVFIAYELDLVSAPSLKGIMRLSLLSVT